MPIRGLMYFSKLYEKYLAGNYAIYSSKLVKIPAPVYFVLYNGEANEPDRKVLHLSDAFIGRPLEINEWSATMLNINYGHNKELLDSCKVLKDYSCFIHRIREYNKTEPIREAREEDRKTIVKAIKTMYTFGIPVIADKLQMTEEEVTRIIKNE